jgi:hypothetical protein
LEIFFVADENSDRDLFGDPVVERQEGRGRPEHRWTLENSNKVLLLFARGRGKADAAAAIGIAVRTLEKHYLREIQQRHSARLRLEATQLARLNKAAEEGNVTAEKELLKVMERGLIEQLPKSMKPAKAPKVGKKQQRHADAADAHKQSSWGDLVEGAGHQVN